MVRTSLGEPKLYDEALQNTKTAYYTTNPRLLHLKMAEKDLSSLLKQLHHTLSSHDYHKSTSLLSKAKLALLQLNALVPSPTTPTHTLALARETLELGALVSIRLQDPAAFTRYFQQLQPFYDLPATTLSHDGSQKSKITGLYLLLLLSQGDYAGFHTLLESLETAVADADADGKGLEEDVFVQYPVKLEQWLMEGSYDRVWGATKSERAPSEEYGVFSEVKISPPPPFPDAGTGEGFGRSVLIGTCVCAGPHRYDSVGDCVLLRESVSFAADFQCQELAVSRE